MIVALAATVLVATSALAASAQSPSNPDQADGPGIITVEQVNMCMWGSVLDNSCFGNPYGDNTTHPSWASEERRIAGEKRASVVRQFQRHIPDVMTVSEGCLNDLRTVAQAVGYQLRYQEVGGGSDGRPHQCSVSRGPGVNAILAKDFGANGPQGYFEPNGYRSYICTEVTTSEWPSVRICTAHLSLPGQEWGGRDDHQEIECNHLRNTLNNTWSTSEFVIFAGDVNMGGNGQIAHCMPDRYHGLKNLERLPEDQASNPRDGLLHIYYTANGFWRQSCAWSYHVEATDHEGFLLELGQDPPDSLGPCWRNVEG